MNYYEHHIRDYDTATSHLTWEEDLAYTRLIRWYYRKEKPIPADMKEACRQVRAISKTQREAVASVLSEFFELCEDGWHNETCDEVIFNYQSGEPEREAKKKNEETRLARHRKERSDLFSIINTAGLHLPWNSPIGEVRALVERIKSAPATPPETPPATATATPATATQAPDTNTHTPVLKNVDAKAAAVHLPQDAAASPPADPITARAIELASMLIHRGAALQASDPRVRRWAETGVSDAQALTALDTAQQRREEQANPQPVNAGLIDAILGDLTAPNSRASPRIVASSREGRISNYAAEAAAARGEYGAEHSTGRVERDITGEAERVA